VRASGARTRHRSPPTPPPLRPRARAAILTGGLVLRLLADALRLGASESRSGCAPRRRPRRLILVLPAGVHTSLASTLRTIPGKRVGALELLLVAILHDSPSYEHTWSLIGDASICVAVLDSPCVLIGPALKYCALPAPPR